MTCTHINGPLEYWMAPNDPTASEVPDPGVIGIYNRFYNSASGELWQCLDPSIGSQVWSKISQIQSDWDQSNSASLDFIQNKPTFSARSFSTPTFSSATTATQLSATRDATVQYVFDAAMTTLLTTQGITATLRYADNSGMSTNVVTVASSTISTGGILSLDITNSLPLAGIIPAGKYRQVTFSTSGGATAPSALASGQEVLI